MQQRCVLACEIDFPLAIAAQNLQLAPEDMDTRDLLIGATIFI
jgi:hypothetical protein